MRSAAQRKRALTRRLAGAFTGVATLALLYTLLAGRDEADVEVGAPAEQRGYFLSGATLTEMGVDGKPRVVVRADTIEQQLADQSVALANLDLDYHTREFGTWRVTARTGRMPPDRQSIELSGDVVVKGARNGEDATIRTERLSYEIDRGIVETRDPVSVRFGSHRLEARGLRAELNGGTLQLESDVHGRFVP
jgi:lipopolysaccharide export system protein LptC